jgi:TolB-like protein/DNA-binding winged helix-turn-helix (wHTH) protein/Flp pilus assembly protein TadD
MNKVYEFGPFRLEAVKRLLVRDGIPIQVTPKALDTLLILIERRGQVVDKPDLLDLLWPDSIVEEINLNVQISTLRKVLGEGPHEHLYIVTVPRRGYSFVAEVKEVGAGGEAALEPSPNKPRVRIEAEKEETPDGDLSEQTDAIPAQSVATTVPAARFGKRPVFIAVAMLILLVSGILSFAWRSHMKRRSTVGVTRKSIAVLPFKALNSQGDEYLEIGMADAVITRLSNLQEVSVLSTGAVFAYAGRAYDSVAAGRQLGVDFVMEGTVQHEDGRVRLTVQLINIADGKPFWGDRFDERAINLLAVQDSISEQVARALSLQINEESRRLLTKHDTDNAEAYEAYMRGLYFWNRRLQGGVGKAVEYFEKAVEKDPRYVQAYAMLADSYAIQANYMFEQGPKRDRVFEKAKSAALRAIELDETTAEAHTALALVKDLYDRDPAGAENAYKRALELNPDYPTAYIRYGWFLYSRGQMEHALMHMQQAARLDPASVVPNIAFAQLLYRNWRFDEAVTQSQKVLELDPDYKTARLTLALAHEAKGRYAEALQETEKAGRDKDGDLETLEMFGHLYAVMGRRDEALRVIEKLQNLAKVDNVALYCIAVIYEGLGEREKALDWIEMAAARGTMNNMGLRIDPRMAALRQHPKYAAIRDRWLTRLN